MLHLINFPSPPPPPKDSDKSHLNEPYCMFDNKYPSILADAKITVNLNANSTIDIDRNIPSQTTSAHTITHRQQVRTPSRMHFLHLQYPPPPTLLRSKSRIVSTCEVTRLYRPSARLVSKGVLFRFPFELARPGLAYAIPSTSITSDTRFAIMCVQPAMLPPVDFGTFAASLRL